MAANAGRDLENLGDQPRIVVLGDVMTDLIVRPHGPVALGSDTPSSIETHAGGAGANLAAWCASEVIAVDFIGMVGADAFGELHRRALVRVGVRPHLTIHASLPTGTLISLVDAAGERSMLADRGANLGLEPGHVPPRLFARPACFHLSGYALLDQGTRIAALAALELARRAGMRIAVDPASAAPLAAVGAAHFLAWTRGADLCLPNLDEAVVLTGERTPEAAASALNEEYGLVALKLGARGALLAARGHAPVTVSAGEVGSSVRETTGAGDAFCAGFLACWLRGGTPAEALAAGVRLGAVAAGRVGARPPGGDLHG
jgi:sugar/nucleoside kinase (ribokinase family)